jgi:hypothetical protein
MTDKANYIEAKGEEILKITAMMSDVVMGERADHVIMACLAMVISIQNPTITVEGLVEGVRGASEWIDFYLTSLKDKPETIN